MGSTDDFSRRFFADFIASRIRAWGLDQNGAHPSRRVPDDSPDGAGRFVGREPGVPGSLSDLRRRRLLDLADPRPSPGMGTE